MSEPEKEVLGYSCWECTGCGSQLAFPVQSQEQYSALSQVNVMPFPPQGAKCKCGKEWAFTGTTWSRP